MVAAGGSRSLAWAMLVVGAVGASMARADVYTWVDKAGNVNVGNVAPPKEARVLHVTHEDPAINARAVAAQAAAREAAHQAEVKALAERVADLERAAVAARNAPPPPPPVRYAAAAPAAPPPVVVYAPPPEPDDYQPLPTWNCAWVGCAPALIVGTFSPFAPQRHNFRHHRAAPPPHNGVQHTPNPAGPTPVPMRM